MFNKISTDFINEIKSNSFINNSKYLIDINERHLHHYFSQWVAKECGCLVQGIYENPNGLVLFPEWPTSKQGHWTDGLNVLYDGPNIGFSTVQPPQGSSAGSIDFAIGKHGKWGQFRPEIVIEFKLGTWDKNAMCLDLMKLLDPRIDYKYAISIVFITENQVANDLHPFHKAKVKTPTVAEMIVKKMDDINLHNIDCSWVYNDRKICLFVCHLGQQKGRFSWPKITSISCNLVENKLVFIGLDKLFPPDMPQ